MKTPGRCVYKDGRTGYVIFPYSDKGKPPSIFGIFTPDRGHAFHVVDIEVQPTTERASNNGNQKTPRSPSTVRARQ